MSVRRYQWIVFIVGVLMLANGTWLVLYGHGALSMPSFAVAMIAMVRFVGAKAEGEK